MSRFLIKGEKQSYGARKPVFEAGSSVSREDPCVFFVLSGRLHLVRKMPGDRIVTIVARQGDVFGVETSFTNASETWEFTALPTQPTEIYCWNRSNYEIILGTYAEIAKATIVNQSRWLRKINQLVSGIDHGHIPEKRLITL